MMWINNRLRKFDEKTKVGHKSSVKAKSNNIFTFLVLFPDHKFFASSIKYKTLSSDETLFIINFIYEYLFLKNTLLFKKMNL